MTSQTASPAPVSVRAAWRRGGLTLADGTSIALFEAGRPDAAAPVLVLVHGLGHWTQAAWDLLAVRFEPTHRIVAFDLPGFGESGKPDASYTLAYFSAALRGVVEALGLHSFALAGHSLGGLIAADYAATYPGDVRQLTLIAPAGFLRTPKLALRIAASRPVIGLLQRMRPSRGFVRRTFRTAVFDERSLPEDYHERAFELSQDRAMTRAFVRVYAGAMQELLHMTALHERLAAWRGPTLIVWGRDDRYVPIRALAGTRAVYPHADVLEIADCGHCPSLEYPDLTAERMRAGGA
jgi:pimeloyl-ACP methyl ester carboxylesterase